MISVRNFLFVVVISGLCSRCTGQSPFERAVAYAKQVSELNQRFADNDRNLQASKKQANELGVLLEEAVGDSRNIHIAGAYQEILTAMTAIERAWIKETIDSDNPRPTHIAYSQHRLRNRENLIEGKLVVATSHLSQLQVAKFSTDARAQKLVAEIVKLSEEFQKNSVSQLRMFEEYRELADMYGLRTKLEWNAALRELAQPSKSNLGARYLRAVLLRRLCEFQQAEAELRVLAGLQSPYQALFVAAHAETLALLGETSQAKRQLGKLDRSTLQFPDISGYRGLVAVASEDWKTAQQAWTVALKNGGQEVALRRNLAILLLTKGRDNQTDREAALENARLASKLSDENEWSVELTRSMAWLANLDLGKAKELGESACELTSGECLAFAIEMIEGYSSGKLQQWDFVEH